jgi:hypothetical protein
MTTSSSSASHLYISSSSSVYFLEVLVTFTSQMCSLRPSPSLPMEVLGMIAKETDDEDIPAQRLVCSLWARATSARFATTFHEVAFELSTTGVAKVIEVCKSSQYGPQFLACSYWASVTATKFASLSHEIAFKFSRAGMLNLLALCKNPDLGPYVRTLIVIVDLKRKIAAKFYEFHD